MNRAEYPPLDPTPDFSGIFMAVAQSLDEYLWQMVDAILRADAPRYERRIRLLFGLLDHALDYPAWDVTPATPPRAREFLELRAQALNDVPHWRAQVEPLMDALVADGVLCSQDAARLRDRLLACRP